MHTTANRRAFDRHEFYVAIHIGLVFAGLGIFLTPSPPGALSVLSDVTNHALAGCMMIGSSMCLAGSAMPLRFWFPQRGRDIRYSMTVGAFGMAAVAVSVIVWGLLILLYSTFVGSLGGVLSVAIGAACLKTPGRFWRHRRDAQHLRRVIADTIADENAANCPQPNLEAHDDTA